MLSVTFQDEKVHSRATAEFGWRYTPYAYMLLEAARPAGRQDAAAAARPRLPRHVGLRGHAGRVAGRADRLPATPAGDPRPVEKLTVTQTLDERQADKGKLILEVKADGVGLVPDLDELCDDRAPPGFEVDEDRRPGRSAVKKFEEDADKNGDRLRADVGH